MPANTPNRGYTYATSDDANDLALISQRLGEQVDADVQAVITARDSAWIDWTPTLTAATTNPNIGTTGARQTGRYKVIGKTVIAEFDIAFATSGTVSAGSGGYYISLPVPARNVFTVEPVGTVFALDGSTCYPLLAQVDANTGPSRIRMYSASGGVTSSAPFAPSTGDAYRGQITYEAA